jgi:hypothetical protein
MPLSLGEQKDMPGIDQQIANIRTHADVLMKIPAGEQFIGNIQAVISIALTDIARILETMRANERRRGPS